LLAWQTLQAAADGAQFVVWPEGTLDFDPQVAHSSELQALARETNTYLVISYGPDTGAGRRNKATILSPEGQFLGVYGKDHPVTLLGEISTSGGTYPTYDTPLGKLGTLTCFDLVFTDSARRVTTGWRPARGPALQRLACVGQHRVHAPGLSCSGKPDGHDQGRYGGAFS